LLDDYPDYQGRPVADHITDFSAFLCQALGTRMSLKVIDLESSSGLHRNAIHRT
jgi:hypothetical protein